MGDASAEQHVLETLPGDPPIPFPPLPLPLPRPPIPLPIPGTGPFPWPLPPLPPIRTLRGGCWLVNYEPVNSPLVAYDGTIRIEHHDSGTTASGDLYQRPTLFVPQLPPRPPMRLLLWPPSPTDGIPIQARNRYRYFLAITSIPENLIFGSRFNMGFQMYRFNGTNNWPDNPPSMTASMSWLTPPTGYPGAYLEGDVKDPAGLVTGRLKLGWVSDSYRKITIEIDTQAGSERPLDNGTGESWATVFNQVGFEMNLHLSDIDVTKPGPDTYSDPEMHDAMLARRETVNLDTTWHYHILAVHFITDWERGVMYDYLSVDSNNVPREGVGIESDWIVDNDPMWGEAANRRWADNKKAYFRTAVHEIGHALGLVHNEVDNGYMCTSPTIASRSGGTFPNNVQWSFNTEDLKRLRHWPDVFVRPGGLEFTAGAFTNLPMTPTDLDIDIPNVRLEVMPILTEIPMGAPVRVELSLTNHGNHSLNVPASLSLKSPLVSGTVSAPFVTPQAFSSFISCTDTADTSEIKPEETRDGSLTLLRGRQGPLFPTSGMYTVTVDLVWPAGQDCSCRVSGSCTVFVTPVCNEKHARAAHKVLSTPDIQLLLMTGGDSERFRKGQEAIDAALKDDTLKKHFAVTEAKRSAKTHNKKEADTVKASELLRQADAVMTKNERAKLKKMGVKF